MSLWTGCLNPVVPFRALLPVVKFHIGLAPRHLEAVVSPYLQLCKDGAL